MILSKVVTPASSYDLISLETVKNDLNESGTSLDSYLSRVIQRASQAVSSFCNRVFQVEMIRDKICHTCFLSCSLKLELTRSPIVSIESIIENGFPLQEDIDFFLEKKTGELTRLSQEGLPIRWNTHSIDIQYEAGFSIIPLDIEEATLRLVRIQYFLRLRDPLLRSESIPGVLQSSWWVDPKGDGTFPQDVVNLISPYRKLVCV